MGLELSYVTVTYNFKFALPGMLYTTQRPIVELHHSIATNITIKTHSKIINLFETQILILNILIIAIIQKHEQELLVIGPCQSYCIMSARRLATKLSAKWHWPLSVAPNTGFWN